MSDKLHKELIPSEEEIRNTMSQMMQGGPMRINFTQPDTGDKIDDHLWF